VRDVFELLESDVASTTPSASLVRVLAPPRRAPSARPMRVLLEAGAALSAGAQTRAAGVLGVGARTVHGAAYTELVLEAGLSSAAHASSEPGRVTEREWQPTLAVRAGKLLGPVSLGALAEVGVAVIHASGVTRDGSRGELTLAAARLGIGLDVRLTLFRGPVNLMLRVAPTLQIDPLPQQLSLDHRRAMELGRLHAFLPLTLLLELPRAGGDDV
ncbi:MAG: hypothetical protein JWN04_274, partial [Myxococcaceae bacterium]|nr:hypothetical protein [Myxococcaceae bacterium]